MTSCGRTEASLIVDATAGGDVLVAAGLDQSRWRRWETLTTDPVQPFLRARVRVDGVEIHQSAQGEVGMTGRPARRRPVAATAWLAAASTLAATAIEAVPLLAQLRLASRSWRSDLVPADGLPAVGPVVAPGWPTGCTAWVDWVPIRWRWPLPRRGPGLHLVDEEPIVPSGPSSPGVSRHGRGGRAGPGRRRRRRVKSSC